ncbi:serine protease inhibitor ecotin [Shewanella subflava]|uniref:Serine protease inhibitor ecotin n=1 Tax=Shewanella subflava TaxID=2986476 RepID=A0ABT3ICD5_9GAMM|nr:serine protease inhibitor ecotin [Shewanella subflava]MCW3173731.1 serine protease inhibitor ecotin [Shewanella subflava]
MINTSHIMAGFIGLSMTVSGSAMATSPIEQEQLNTPAVQTEVFTQSHPSTSDQINMFPVAASGMQQHVITLPKLANEDDFLLEIQIGQNKLVDCNRHRLMGDVQTVTVEGWGYDYVKVDNVMSGPSTMMMCKDPKTTQFVMLGESIKVNYDSRLPKIFYLPENTELRYRIWRADSPFTFSK